MNINRDDRILLFVKIYIYLLPFFILPIPHFFFNKIRYADLVFLPIFFFWIDALFRKKFALPDFRLPLILGILLISNLFSFIYSLDRMKSLFDFLGLIYLTVLFITFASLLSKDSFMQVAITALEKVTFFISLIGIISFFIYYFKIDLQSFNLISYCDFKTQVVPFVRISSVCALPEMFISFSQLGLVCAILNYFVLNKKRNNKLSGIIRVGIIILALILAWSRALVGVFLMLSLILMKVKSGNLRLLREITVAFFLVIFLGSLVTSIWMVYPVEIKRNPVAQEISLKINTAPDLRSINRHAAIRMFKESPFFGFGQGMFTYNVIRYINKDDVKKTFILNKFKFDGFLADPHSTFFGALSETGALGLSAMLLLFFFIISNNFAALSSREITTSWCFLSCFLGYLLSGLSFDIFAFRHLWLNMALLIGANNILKIKNDEKKKDTANIP